MFFYFRRGAEKKRTGESGKELDRRCAGPAAGGGEAANNERSSWEQLTDAGQVTPSAEQRDLSDVKRCFAEERVERSRGPRMDLESVTIPGASRTGCGREKSPS